MEKLAQDAAKKRNLSEDIAKLLSSKRAEEASGHTRDGNIVKLWLCNNTFSPWHIAIYEGWGSN